MVLVNIRNGCVESPNRFRTTYDKKRELRKAKELVNTRKPIVTSESLIKSTKKLDDRGFVENIMKRYENEWKTVKNTKTINADMFIPKEKLNTE